MSERSDPIPRGRSFEFPPLALDPRYARKIRIDLSLIISRLDMGVIRVKERELEYFQAYRSMVK